MITCPCCGSRIEPTYEDLSFDYAGTHCTGGMSGTYHDHAWLCTECDGNIPDSLVETEEWDDYALVDMHEGE